jgi:pimeloyl-ACP methyl ester carboxylesterase
VKSWNEYTKSKFLTRLKKLGDTYTYQDKVNNIFGCDKSEKEHIDYDTDIDFDFNYLNPDKHLAMVLDDVKRTYDIRNYDLIPLGWSAGCFFALYFAQKYPSLCSHVICLDPALFTPHNIKLRLEEIDERLINNKLLPITNAKLQKLIGKLKNNNNSKPFNVEDMFRVNDAQHHIRSNFFKKHLRVKFKVPVTAFVNVQEPEKKEWSKDFNNATRLEEIRELARYNTPDMYKAYILRNASHYVFDKVAPAKKIIKVIREVIREVLD